MEKKEIEMIWQHTSKKIEGKVIDNEINIICPFVNRNCRLDCGACKIKHPNKDREVILCLRLIKGE